MLLQQAYADDFILLFQPLVLVFSSCLVFSFFLFSIPTCGSFKVRLKTQEKGQTTRYRVSPNQGHLLPNSTTTVYVYIEETNVNEILQLSCDTSNPVQCNDKILIMGVSMKKEAYDHFLTESEEAQKKIEKILFDAKNKKSIFFIHSFLHIHSFSSNFLSNSFLFTCKQTFRFLTSQNS